MHLSWVIVTLIILYIIFIFITWLMEFLVIWGAIKNPSSSYQITNTVFSALAAVTFVVLVIVIAVNLIIINQIGEKYRERFLEVETNFFPEKEIICEKNLRFKRNTNAPINRI